MATVDGGRSPAFQTLSELVATFPARAEKAAVIAFRNERSEELSYGQLADGIARVAQGLRARGIGPGDMVALWAPNSPEWVIAYFGIVCAGATAIPLDHQSTIQGVTAPLVHAAPRLLLTTAAHHPEVQAHPELNLADTLLLDCPADAQASWEQLRAAPNSELPEVAATELASLLYTSGTTGTPKAVPLTHGNLAGNASGLLAADLIDSADRVLVPLPLHHTYPFTVGLLTALGAGATVIFPAGISGPEISRAAAAGKSTILLAVPRLCSALWDSVLAGVRGRGRTAVTFFFALLALSRGVRRVTGLHVGKWLFRAVHERLGRQLKLIGCGGAKLPYQLTWQLEALGWTVLTGYGLTETSPVLTFNDRTHSRLGSEGRPLPGVQLRIAPERDGRHGEILARGPNVFTGYWNNPSATTAAFADGGWFRTGDLGWQDADGYLYVVGRSKELIVLPDGKKLFAETVEKLYAASALLREIGIFEHEGGLAAVLVLDEQALRARGTLRESALLREALEDIAAQLPPYQRIGAYRVVHTALPRTQLGKLKRHLLAALFAAAQAGEAGPTAAATPTEADQALLGSARAGAVWQWLNERHPDRHISLDTSPQLDLQIDSLEWVALTIELEQRFQVTLGGEVLSRILTVRDLLLEVEGAVPSTAGTTTQLPPFEPPGAVLRAVGAVILFVLRPIVRAAFRLTITGAERLPAGQPLVITPNHASYLDPLVIAAALPWRQLRKTYWAGWVGVLHTNALRRFLSRAAQVFPIDPDRDLATAIRTAQELLRRGYSIVWFPEGRRSPTGELERFQSGIGLLLHGGAAAVPTAVRGTFTAWPKQRALPRLQHVDVTFGDALTFASTTSDDAGERIRTELEAAVRRLIAESSAPGQPAARNQLAHRANMTQESHMPPTCTEHWTETLRDGRRALIRPIRRDDVPGNAAFVETLSPSSKHFLFLGGITRLSDRDLQRLCAPDYVHDMAYVAFAADDGSDAPLQVGVSRYAGADSSAGAEISVAVADDWQHQGLGKSLLQHLIAYARAHGVARLYSIDATNNTRMRGLARDLGFAESPDPNDRHQVLYTLNLATP